MEIFTLILIVIITVILFPRRRWFYVIYKTFPRDIRAAERFVRLNYQLRKCHNSNQTLPKIFKGIVSRHPSRVAIYFEDQQWTFQKLDEVSNQVAHYFKSKGLIRGDAVALFLESRPEYVAIWLGLSKIGVITALINNNLISDPLVHSVLVSNAKALIFGSTSRKVIKDVHVKLPNVDLYEWQEVSNDDCYGTNLNDELKKQPITALERDIANGKPKDKLVFIYTSGTTGLPKAAVISHMRLLFMAYGMNYMTKLRDTDILYDPLPLYHSAGGMLGVGQVLICGVPVVIRRKFSASNFWTDCNKYNCTAAQYIGEMCRYILAVHAKNDKPVPHSVRFIIGNGLKPQIWKEFVNRFKIPEVYEFYGSTEGNSNLINIDNRIGAVGFVPRYARLLYPVTLIKCNEATGEPIRNKNGYCEDSQPGEPGILIGKVKQKSSINDFEGYADKAATKKKLIPNVFKKGDLYFNTGDILVQDEFGYYYFKDRTGDTFRWKGENVATTEVEAVVSNIINFKDAAVYGVEIPESEGRAGMVAIVDTDRSLDIENLAKNLKNNLPSYAVPIFLRVMETVPLTGTFKLKKVDLQKEGFDIHNIKDRLYVFDAKNIKYVELTNELYDSIMNGKMRL